MTFTLDQLQASIQDKSAFGQLEDYLGYTLALNRLDGVYYVDPRPDMVTDEALRAEIDSFQRFLVHDVWEF
jgi:hypothetical protein